VEIHRPRSLGWPRAAALLYGDWGTSKTYVIGLAVAGFGSLPLILAVCALSLIVGLNYIIICKCSPGGGGVYSAARPHSVTVPHKIAAMVESMELEKLKPGELEGGKIPLCLRGITPVLKFAVENAKLRGAALYVLYVREVAVAFGAVLEGEKARWQDDPETALIMKTARAIGEEAGVSVVPVYAVAESAGVAIADVAATLGMDELFLGASGHSALAHLLHGSVVQQVVKHLPDDIALVIRG